MPLRDRRFLDQERWRLTRYRNQHRGLSFTQLWLPPISDKNVNIIGYDNHVYKGKIPRVPLDKLPSDVDPKYVDEEKFYEEIRDMKFLNVPPQEPLGPTRRVGGEYTKTKQLRFAPVEILDRKVIEETPIIGADGMIYRGSTSKSVPVFEFDRKLQESKGPIHSPTPHSSKRDFVIPTTVSLQVDGESPSARVFKESVIQMPASEINRIINAMRSKDIGQKMFRVSVEDDYGSADLDSKTTEDNEDKPDIDKKSDNSEEEKESESEEESEAEELEESEKKDEEESESESVASEEESAEVKEYKTNKLIFS